MSLRLGEDRDEPLTQAQTSVIQFLNFALRLDK